MGNAVAMLAPAIPDLPQLPMTIHAAPDEPVQPESEVPAITRLACFK